jgi:uncharacterized membrane protein YfcA
MDYIIGIISFFAAFVFALGGIGAAVILIPILVSLGIPISAARPIGLFSNIISMTGASISNIRHKRLDYKIGMPIIITSFISAIVGAYISQFIPTSTILILYILFLIFSGLMFLFHKKKETQGKNIGTPYFSLSMIGTFAGFLSGILGIGGGSIISPLMLMIGYHPKKITVITAFVIPFSSLSGFITYWIMGNINWYILTIVTISATIGASLGTMFMHKRLNPQSVKKILAVILLAMAVKLSLTLI